MHCMHLQACIFTHSATCPMVWYIYRIAGNFRGSNIISQFVVYTFMVAACTACRYKGIGI